jgi:hypothetical protein
VPTGGLQEPNFGVGIVRARPRQVKGAVNGQSSPIGVRAVILLFAPPVKNVRSVGRGLTAALNVRVGHPNLVLAKERIKLESAHRGASTARTVRILGVQTAASGVRNSRIALALAVVRNAQPSPPTLGKTIAVRVQTNFRIVQAKIVVLKMDAMIAGPASLICAAMQARGDRETSPIKRAAGKGQEGHRNSAIARVKIHKENPARSAAREPAAAAKGARHHPDLLREVAVPGINVRRIEAEPVVIRPSRTAEAGADVLDKLSSSQSSS